LACSIPAFWAALLASACAYAVKDGDAIDALVIETKSGRAAVRARVFIDCSGDGDLAALAGVPYEVGDGAGNMLYPTMIAGVDPVEAGQALRTVPALMEAAERTGRAKFPRKGGMIRPMAHPSEWRVNFTQVSSANPTPARAASTTCPIGCWCRPGCAISWSPAAAPA
jgi:hypothetical protein